MVPVSAREVGAVCGGEEQNDEKVSRTPRAETQKQEREDIYVALQYAASFHCLVKEWKDCGELKPKLKEKWSFVDRKNEGTKHRTEWRAEADRYRCMRCGKGSKYMKMPGKVQDHNSRRKVWENGEDVIWEVMTSSEEWTDRVRY